MHILHLFPNGDVVLEPGQLGKISLEHILDLKSYSISRMQGRVMHVMEFIDGGTCEITYVLAADGTALLEVFQGSRIKTKICPDDRVVLGCLDSPKH
jgi:hypothetical protein